MLRHLMSLCIVLCLFASMTRADDKPVSAAPTTEGEGAGAGEVVVPAEVHRLEGKVVKIYDKADPSRRTFEVDVMPNTADARKPSSVA